MVALNSDFRERVVVHAGDLDWVASPMPGVERRMLDRVGDEVARATTIVRYAPGSNFSAHVHGGGEEFLVLKGVFQDEHGDYPAGSYLRNPPTSSHTPGSAEGCEIFVKLHQFEPTDRIGVRHRWADLDAITDPQNPGRLTYWLHRDDRERVSIEVAEANIEWSLDAAGGAEIFVLDGELSQGGEGLRPQSWLRLPVDSSTRLRSGDSGVRFWLKTGHLRFAEREVARLASG